MQHKVADDEFVAIRVDGLHCHKCQETVRRALCALPGVHEVEVDLDTRLVSVLFDRALISVKPILEALRRTGYPPTSYTQGGRESTTTSQT